MRIFARLVAVCVALISCAVSFAQTTVKAGYSAELTPTPLYGISDYSSVFAHGCVSWRIKSPSGQTIADYLLVTSGWKIMRTLIGDDPNHYPNITDIVPDHIPNDTGGQEGDGNTNGWKVYVEMCGLASSPGGRKLVIVPPANATPGNGYQVIFGDADPYPVGFLTPPAYRYQQYSATFNVASGTVAVPSAPTSLTVSSSIDLPAQLSWTASPDTVLYTIKVATTSGGPYTAVGATAPYPPVTYAGGPFNFAPITGPTNFSVVGTAVQVQRPTDGQPRYYVITAVNAHGESSTSNQVTVTPYDSVPIQRGTTGSLTPSAASVNLPYDVANPAPNPFAPPNYTVPFSRWDIVDSAGTVVASGNKAPITGTDTWQANWTSSTSTYDVYDPCTGIFLRTETRTFYQISVKVPSTATVQTGYKVRIAEGTFRYFSQYDPPQVITGLILNGRFSVTP